MPNTVFNFYQGTGYGTGIGRPRSTISFFTGAYLPSNVPLGGDVGFFWGLYDKDVDQQVLFYGEQQSDNRDAASTFYRFSGQITPLVTDVGTLYAVINSGSVASGNVDRTFINFNWSGRCSGDNIDRSYFYSILKSGNMSSGNKDTATYSVKLSGQQTSGMMERLPLSVTFRGSFIGNNNYDSTVTTMTLTSIVYGNSVSHTTQTGSTGVFLSFNIGQIIYGNSSE